MDTDEGGLQFLIFHRNLIEKVHQWYATQPGYDPIDLAPSWTTIPPEMKWTVPKYTWEGEEVLFTDELKAQEKRLITRTYYDPELSTSGKLGRFIEGNLHRYLHNAASIAYGEPILTTFHSQRSTWFYKIHGLVQFWWDFWSLTRAKHFTL